MSNTPTGLTDNDLEQVVAGLGKDRKDKQSAIPGTNIVIVSNNNLK